VADAWLWGAVAASSLVIGAALGLARSWPRPLVGITLAFGAGALISAVAFELAAKGFRYGATAWETSVRIPYWGSRRELIEVIEMARSGALRPQIETFPLREAVDVYRRLHDGQISGRAVVLPHD
jgi:propanol-preferring alcohol dehydrogenase